MVARTIDSRVKIQRIALERLKPAPYNPREIGKREREGLRESLTEFGVVEPIIWNRRTGHICGGHQRASVLAEAGVKETDVVVVDLDEKREKALNVALNNPKLQGQFTDDVRALIEEIARELPDLSERLMLPELDRSLDHVLGRREGTAVEDPPAPPPPKNPVAKRGDLFVLGRHRLLCGDSTREEDVARLMNGEKAALLATDPPYLVDYQGGNHPQSWFNRAEVKEKHWDDYSDPEAGVAFYEDFLKAALAHCADRVPVYQWYAHRRQSLLEEAWVRAGLLASQQIIWVKARPVLTRQHLLWKHEPCMYGWVKGKIPRRRPPSNMTTVWEIGQQGEQDGIHPTQKPVELFSRPIEWHTSPGAVCLEPFSGSGTQIAAAEQLERRCFAMEIEPAYVDVAVLRWEQFTGKKAKRTRS